MDYGIDESCANSWVVQLNESLLKLFIWTWTKNARHDYFDIIISLVNKLASRFNKKFLINIIIGCDWINWINSLCAKKKKWSEFKKSLSN